MDTNTQYIIRTCINLSINWSLGSIKAIHSSKGHFNTLWPFQEYAVLKSPYRNIYLATITIPTAITIQGKMMGLSEGLFLSFQLPGKITKTVGKHDQNRQQQD